MTFLVSTNPPESLPAPPSLRNIGMKERENNETSTVDEEIGPKTPISTPRNPAPPSLRNIGKMESENNETSTVDGEIGTETPISTPRKSPEKVKQEKTKVLYTNGFFSFLASPAPGQTNIPPTHNNPPLKRSNLDFARDKKRILEICYEKRNSTEIVVSIDPSQTDDKGSDKNSKSYEKKEKKKKKKKKKSSKKEEKGQMEETKAENQSDSSNNVDTPENTQGEVEGKTAGEMPPSKDEVNPESDGIGNPQDGNEEEGGAEGTKPRSPKKKKKKKSVVVKRDKAGRVIRKRRKNKSRGRVVHPDCFKKGKHANISLATIDEGFYDGIESSDIDSDYEDYYSRDSSRDTFDSNDCDAIWCTGDIESPPNSSDDNDSDFERAGDGDDDIDSCHNVKKTESTEKTASTKSENTKTSGEQGNTSNIFGWIMRKKAKKPSWSNKVSSTDEVAPTAGKQLYAAPAVSSNFLNDTNTTVVSNESLPEPSVPVEPTAPAEPSVPVEPSVPAEPNIPAEPSVPIEVVTTDDSQALGSDSEESVDSTCCTSTASFRNEGDGRSKLCCFRSRWAMAFTGLLFVITVAAGTVALGYVFVFRNRSDDEDIGYVAPFAPTVAPSMELRPNLRPSQNPSPAVIATPPPGSILYALSTSCYLPNDMPGTSTMQAEHATTFNFASISNANSGYCGEGYVSLVTRPRSAFAFSSLEAELDGYYTIAVRYNNINNAKISLGLKIDNREVGFFDLLPTGNETSWMVDSINNVLLRKGESTVRISLLDFDQTAEPKVDWLTIVLEKQLSTFDYYSSLLAEASGISAQTLLQTGTLQWMSNEDLIDYSDLTDVEIIERYALLQIYHSTAGDMWKNNSLWLSEFHVCDWHGITCSSDMLVTDLTLDNNELIGFLPTDISLLTNLMVITLDNNSLQGSLPTQIGRLNYLSKLFLHANFFTGALPSELGSLKELQSIDLRTNSLNGEIPEEFFSLERLEKVALGSNFLSGTLSTSVGLLRGLKDLDLQIGQLSGTIPTELGELTLLTNLSLGYNRFTGRIPGELGLLQKLSLLDVNSNKLTGILPPELSLLEDTVIDYYGNDIIA